ncbi:MAG TPA: dihydrofolate reductase [Steroidobacteraceae bacterium]|nr:dihydrofolate reductase [Steroidobacteraceae bacterium]
MKPLVSIVVAMDERDAIGHEGGLPWRLPGDLKRFKALTMGKPVVMGRKTWESIGKPLPGRHNIVVTRRRGLEVPGVTVVDSVTAAITAAGDAPEVCIIGGAEIYRLALPITDVLHVTRVHATVAADTHFPSIDPADWEEVARREQPADEAHPFACSFVELRRKTRQR